MRTAVLPLLALLAVGCTGQIIQPKPDGEDTGGDTTDPNADLDEDGFSPADGDCDDDDASVNPDATESCNGKDDDCDGASDENDAEGVQTYYFDGDGDGFGDSDNTAVSCEPYENFVAEGGDCDDTRDYVNPAAEETCNNIDDNCDGTPDEGVPADADTFTADADGDGFGAIGGDTTQACAAPEGYAADATDCDDTNAAIYPGAPDGFEDGVDDDCDGQVDEDAACNPYRPWGNGAAASWTYRTTAYDGQVYTEAVTINSWNPAGGVAVLQRFMAGSAGTNYTVLENHTCVGDATALTSYSLTDGVFTSVNMALSTPRKDIDDPSLMVPGYSWSFAYDASDALGLASWSVTGETQVIGFESVTTAAGTFADALVLETRYTLVDSGGGFGFGTDLSRTSTITAYNVLGLGVVKVEDIGDDGFLWEDRELTAYSGFTPE